MHRAVKTAFWFIQSDKLIFGYNVEIIQYCMRCLDCTLHRNRFIYMYKYEIDLLSNSYVCVKEAACVASLCWNCQFVIISLLFSRGVSCATRLMLSICLFFYPGISSEPLNLSQQKFARWRQLVSNRIWWVWIFEFLRGVRLGAKNVTFCPDLPGVTFTKSNMAPKRRTKSKIENCLVWIYYYCLFTVGK